MKRRSNNNKLTYRFLIPGVSLFVIATLFVGIKLGLQNITLSTIECQSQIGECGETTKKKLASLVGEDYAQVIRLVKNFADEEPTIGEYHVQYIPLRSLRVTIAERKPVYAIAIADGDRLMLIDKDGRFLGITESTDLPTLFIQRGRMSKGESLSKTELFALKIASDMEKTFKVNKAELHENTLTIELEDHMKVVFPTEGDMEVLMGAAILIYNDVGKADWVKLNTRGQIIDTIDLRFNNPVLH